jgi:HlyD family secretion protein
VRKSELEQREAELKLLIEENRLQLESEKAQVEFSDVSLEDAKRQFEEQKEMVARNLVAEGSLESERINLLQAELNVKDAKIKLRKLQENQSSKVRSKEADIRKANVRVEKEQDRIDELREKIESAKVVSTRDGFINYLMTWRGKRVKIAEGDNVWRRSGILEIPDATQMEVTVPINELDITSIEEGQKATVSVAAIPGETFPGKVNRKGKVPITRVNDPFGNNREGVKNFEVFIELDEQDKRLRQNMTATAVIEVAREEDTLAVPLDAIFSKKGSDGEKNTYYVLLNDGGNLAEIEVKQQVVGSNFATVEPVGDGVTLAEGSRVLLRDPRK